MIMRVSPALHLLLGPAIWLTWFVVLYSVVSLVCTQESHHAVTSNIDWLQHLLIALTLLVAALLALASRQLWVTNNDSRPRRVFLVHVGAAAYLSSSLATLFFAIPLLWSTACM